MTKALLTKEQQSHVIIGLYNDLGLTNYDQLNRLEKWCVNENVNIFHEGEYTSVEDALKDLTSVIYDIEETVNMIRHGSHDGVSLKLVV